jgi:hypothetical protein
MQRQLIDKAIRHNKSKNVYIEQLARNGGKHTITISTIHPPLHLPVGSDAKIGSSNLDKNNIAKKEAFMDEALKCSVKDEEEGEAGSITFEIEQVFVYMSILRYKQ